MASSAKNALSRSSRTEQSQGGTFDSLEEQMTSLLRLRSPLASHHRRDRRLSDTDRPRSSSENISLTASVRSNAATMGNALATRKLPNLERQHEQRHSCSAEDCSLKRVFQLPEILEIICQHLDLQDVLAFRGVSQHCDYTVREFKKIQLRFFITPQWRRPGADFEVVPLTLPGLTIERGEELHLGQWIKVAITPEAAKRIVSDPTLYGRVRSRSIFEGLRGGLGNRVRVEGSTTPWPTRDEETTSDGRFEPRHFFITQPPIKGMQGFIVDKEQSGSDTVDEDIESRASIYAKVSCDSGITLGFLAHHAQELLRRGNRKPDEKGILLVFKAILSFTEPEKAPPQRGRSDTGSVIYL